MLPSEQPDDKAIIIKLMVPSDDVVFILFFLRRGGLGQKDMNFLSCKLTKTGGGRKKTNKQTKCSAVHFKLGKKMSKDAGAKCSCCV